MRHRRIRSRAMILSGLIVSTIFLVAASPAQDPNSERLGPKPPVPPGAVLVDGDILMPADKAAAGGAPTPWPDGIVYFEFDANVNGTNRQLMLDAMDEWNYSGADVMFLPRNSALNDDFVHIQDGSANNSFIGMITGSQVINITNWDRRFTMAHELCHALGFWHEQSRTDRDTFVDIQTANIESGHENNFEIRNNWLVQNTGYDYDSIMHYGQFFFTDCAIPTPFLCETIICLSPNEGWQWFIGQRDHLSVNDMADMADAYGSRAIGPRYIDWSAPPSAEDGSLRYPFRSVAVAEATAPDNSEFWVRGGTYDELGTTILNKPGTYRVHNGVVRVQ